MGRRWLPVFGLFAVFLAGAAPPASPASLTVTNVNDSGAGSLRQAILDSNASVGVADTILFNIPGTANLVEIIPATPLPTITDPVTINTDGQPQGQIVVNGFLLPAPNAVLTISAGSTTIRGLGIVGGNDAGIRLQTTGGNDIQYCMIGGTGKSHGRVKPVPNAGPGVDVEGGTSNKIRYTTIAFNGGPGIVVRSGATGVEYSNDLIYSNASPQVDLGGDGRTLNDPGDGDTGANELLNYPILTRVLLQTATHFDRAIHIEGMIDAAPSTVYTLCIFFGTLGAGKDDPQLTDLGTVKFGSLMTNPSGQAPFSFELNMPDPQTIVTAALEDAAGNMSELSPPLEVPGALTESGCGAVGLEWLIVPLLAALRRRRRATSAP